MSGDIAAPPQQGGEGIEFGVVGHDSIVRSPVSQGASDESVLLALRSRSRSAQELDLLQVPKLNLEVARLALSRERAPVVGFDTARHVGTREEKDLYPSLAVDGACGVINGDHIQTPHLLEIDFLATRERQASLAAAVVERIGSDGRSSFIGGGDLYLRVGKWLQTIGLTRRGGRRLRSREPVVARGRSRPRLVRTSSPCFR